MRLSLPIIAVVFLAFVLHGTATAGYMSDGSSMYSDTWGDSSGVWGYGQLIGRMNIHKYAVDVKITSPKDASPLLLECTAHMAAQRRAKRTFLGI